jgi:hypothetical protein
MPESSGFKQNAFFLLDTGLRQHDGTLVTNYENLNSIYY